MKVEIICKNLTCPTRIDRAQPQLVECHKLRLGNGRQIPVDEDNDPIGCPWCGKAVTIDRLSRTAAQFPLGRVDVAQDARTVLGDDLIEWAEEAAQLVAMHVSGDHGSVTEEILTKNRQVISTLPFVQTTDSIVSQYFAGGARLWVVSTPARGITTVLGEETLKERVGEV